MDSDRAKFSLLLVTEPDALDRELQPIQHAATALPLWVMDWRRVEARLGNWDHRPNLAKRRNFSILFLAGALTHEVCYAHLLAPCQARRASVAFDWEPF